MERDARDADVVRHRRKSGSGWTIMRGARRCTASIMKTKKSPRMTEARRNQMYKFSKRSKDRLVGVHPDLVKVVHKALELSPVDFAVVEGLRTMDRQRELVAKGASQTLNSRHITGHAVDLAPVIDGTVRWDWPPIYKIAEAMRLAAAHHGIQVVWGGAWHTSLYGKTAKELSNDYVDLRRAQGKTPFLDGVHFQLSRTHYP